MGLEVRYMVFGMYSLWTFGEQIVVQARNQLGTSGVGWEKDWLEHSLMDGEECEIGVEWTCE